MRTLVALTLFLATFFAADAQQPTVLHGQVTQGSGKSLAAEIATLKQSTTPVWLGYRIAVDNFHGGWNGNRTIYLEGDHPWGGNATSSGTLDHALVLLRLADHAVSKIRIENDDRDVDAGGAQFVWLASVTPEESIAMLKGVAIAGSDQLRDSALFALATHRSPTTIPTLIELASPGHGDALRDKAAFWLSSQSSQHGPEALEAIRQFAENDSDEHFREKLTFDLTLIKQPAALDELIRMAHQDRSSHVRKQAQFWMATIGGKRVTADLQDAVANDPEGEVRKSAVFALSRLPGDEATTQLIHTAKQSKDPEVRKQAVFWLGQSSDPRALAYLTALLK